MNTEHDALDTGANRQRDKFICDESSLGDVSVKRNDQLGKEKVGDCHIFDYQEFKKPRLGSEYDADRLEYDFKKLDFNVYRYLNLTKSDTMDVLAKASKKDHSQSKYFVCCFLTHGGMGTLCMKDYYVKIDDILNCFSSTSCPSLYKKPKIFIIQACRGTGVEDGIKESTDSDSSGDNPEYIDFLIVNSTYEGTFSFKTLSLRDETQNHGSFFIDELCRSLENFSSNKDLLQILTIVNYRVATFFKSVTDNAKTNKKKQMPCIISRLRAEVKFNKKIDMFESVHTRYFDDRRRQHPLGLQSMQNPYGDHKLYHIPNYENVKFLSILNTKGNFGEELNHFALKLWSCIADKNYQREEKEILKKTELKDYLKTFAGQKLDNVSCFICFVAGCAKGDYLYDSQNKKFFKRDLVEHFVGKKCPVLAGKPKIFIFLLVPQIKPKRFYLPIPCVSADSPDEYTSTTRNFIPVHADILEVTIFIKDTKQLEVIGEKLISILKKDELHEDLLQSLTKMNNDLVKDTLKDGKYSPSGSSSECSSLLEENISFSFHSTLTKVVKLP